MAAGPAKSMGPVISALPAAPVSMKQPNAGVWAIETVWPSESITAIGSGELKFRISAPRKIYRAVATVLCRHPGLVATAFSVVVLLMRSVVV